MVNRQRGNAVAVHRGAGQRWHWVGYPYKLGLSVKPDYAGEPYAAGTAELVARESTGDAPDWNQVETYTLPLVFPGLLIWDDLVDASYRRADDVRSAAVTMWELHEIGSEPFTTQ